MECGALFGQCLQSANLDVTNAHTPELPVILYSMTVIKQSLMKYTITQQQKLTVSADVSPGKKGEHVCGF